MTKRSTNQKVCQGCPERFEGCVKLADDQSLPYISPEHLAPFRGYKIQQDMLTAGWRKVELSERQK